MGTETEAVAIHPLVADLIVANMDALNATTNRLIDNWKDRAEIAEATVAAMRDRIGALLSGDYMPTPAAIERAMYPREKTIAVYRQTPDS